MGELRAVTSADLVDGIAVCVLHCSPEVRRTRLRARGEPEDSLVHHVRFGEWFLRHSTDPTHAPEVIREDGAEWMRWDRWEQWQRGDPRWSPEIIETDELTPDQVADQVEAWARSVIGREV